MFLEIEQLRKSYGTGENKVEVLKGIQLGVEKGKICVLLGPSGSGKSTLLNIVGGIDTADSGSVTVAGEVMQSMNDRQLTEYRRKHLGYVFQAYNLIGNLKVRENIDVLGLTEHQNKIPSQLSGGQQQRTAIGRAIVKNPDILLCDEPTGALDYHTSKDILALIERVNQKYGNTIVIVTHNDAIKNMADQIVKLKDGQIQDVEMNAAKVPAEQLEW